MNLLGPFLGGFAASKIGRKWGLMSSIVPLLAGWIMVALATSVPVLYAARIVWGVAVGMLFTISPMYCAEIATVILYYFWKSLVYNISIKFIPLCIF